MRVIVAVVYLCGFVLGYVVCSAVGGGAIGLVVGGVVTLAFQCGLYQVQSFIEAGAASRHLRQELERARAAVEMESPKLEAGAQPVDRR